MIIGYLDPWGKLSLGKGSLIVAFAFPQGVTRILYLGPTQKREVSLRALHAWYRSLQS